MSKETYPFTGEGNAIDPLAVTTSPLGGDILEKIDTVERETVLARSQESGALLDTGVSDLAVVVDGANRRSSTEAVDSFNEKGFVRQAPSFRDQVVDNSRQMPFRYFVSKGVFRNMTEHDGLVQLDTFLSTFIRDVGAQPSNAGNGVFQRKAQLLVGQAKSMREGLTFIGWGEYQQAVKGIGARWKACLDENPGKQLCTIAEVSSFKRYEKFGNRKSDDFVREDVLLTFSDEEMELYGDRIVGSLDEITNEPEDVKIVLLDDWTISGRQMSELYKMVQGHQKGAAVARAGNVEINLVAASASRIKNGLLINPKKKQKGTIPVYSYFRANEAKAAQFKRNAPHITGQHSAVNYDFSDTLIEMFKLHERVGGPKRQILGLARVEPWYRTLDSVVDLGAQGASRVDIYDSANQEAG
jgi:hypothetical protein